MRCIHLNEYTVWYYLPCGAPQEPPKRSFTGNTIRRGSPSYSPSIRSMIIFPAISPISLIGLSIRVRLGCKWLRQFKVVEADKRYIPWYLYPHIHQSFIRADAHQVIMAYNCRGRASADASARSPRYMHSLPENLLKLHIPCGQQAHISSYPP